MKICKLIQEKNIKLENIDQFKEENLISLESVYPSLMKEWYNTLVELFKLSLLIAASTANVERGFFALALLATKQWNSLSPDTLDKLMCIKLLGPPKPDTQHARDVDRFPDSKDCQINTDNINNQYSLTYIYLPLYIYLSSTVLSS